MISELIPKLVAYLQTLHKISNTDFEQLMIIIGSIIARQDTKYREAICVQDRLAITLQFLVRGDSYHSLMYLFKALKQIINQIVPKICSVTVY